MKLRFFSILILITLTSCKSGSGTTRQQSDKTKAVQKAIADKDIKINFDKAFPQGSMAFQQAYYNLHLMSPGSTASAIDLSGITSYLKIKGDTISGRLPFYGQRYFGGGYGDRGSIHFDDVPKSYDAESKEKRTEIRFTIPDKKHSIESYQAFLKIFDNGQAYLNLSSTQRSNIGYRGSLKIKDSTETKEPDKKE